MMTAPVSHVAEGWAADWLVGWLASLGVAYRDRSIKLSWSAEATPLATFHLDSVDRLTSVLPSEDELDSLAIAREVADRFEFPRNPSREAYSDRALMARSTGDLSLGATVSDIGVAVKDDLPHSPLDPSVPRGITLGERAATSRRQVEELGVSIIDSMAGLGRVSERNGLGFDLRRRAASCVPGPSLTDPCAETLALFGILAFTQVGELARGWQRGGQFKTGAFRWPAWSVPLDWPAIDAYLGEFYSATPVASSILVAEYDSISYRPTGSADTTRGIDGVAARAQAASGP